MLTKEEKELMDRLSEPPKCMHDTFNIIDHGKHWECRLCGLKAKKSVEVLPGVFINEA